MKTVEEIKKEKLDAEKKICDILIALNSNDGVTFAGVSAEIGVFLSVGGGGDGIVNSVLIDLRIG